MNKIDLNFKALSHQIKFINSHARYLCNSGGVGSGKTYSIILKTLALAGKYNGIFILIGAQTLPLLRDTTLREFFNICPDYMIKEYNKSTLKVILVNGSEIIFRPFDDPNKLKSLNLGAIGIEEMSDVKEEIFKMARTRLRQIGMPGYLYGATNAGSFTNWVYKYFIENPIENSEVIYSRTVDNVHLPEEYLKDLDNLKKSNPDYYRRMVEGLWGNLEGLIYNLPAAARIEPNDIPKCNRYIAGLDFGFEHPTAFTVFGQRENNYYQIDELYRHHMTSGDIVTAAKNIIDKYNCDIIYCDSARPEIIEDLKRQKIPAVAANKDVFAGIMQIKTMIGSGRLLISKNCNYTLREFDSYVWDNNNTVKEIPLKVNDDCMDSSRYALYTDSKRFERKVIEKVRIF